MPGPWEKYAQPAQDGPWSKYGSQAPSTPIADQIPGGGLAGNRNVGKPDTSSFMDKAKGAGEAALTMGSGMFGAAAGSASALADLAFGSQSMQGADKKFGQVAAANTYAPRTDKGRDYVGAIGEAFDKSKIPVTPITGEFTNALKSAPKAGMLAQMVKESPEVAGLKQGARAVGDKLPKMNIKLSPEMAELNSKARAFGITLQPHQLSDNKYIKILGETLNKIPASGAKTAQNQTALERALIAEIGGDTSAAALTPKVFDQAMRRSGTTIDAITRKNKFVADTAFADKLKEVKDQAMRLETGDNAKVISGWVDEINSKLVNGQMSGTQFRKLNSKLGTKIRSTESDLKSGLSDLQDALLERFNEGITGTDKEKFLQARTQYAKAKALAPVVGDPRGVSGSKLLSSVRNTKANKERYARGLAGSMGDLADIGQLLKDPGSSNTAERGLIYSGLAGFSNPAYAIPAAGAYGAANLYNRLGPMLIPKK